MTQPAERKLVATNRKARFEYEILETVEAGIALVGPEVKSLRAGKANLTDAYAVVRRGEVYLLGAHVSPYEKAHRDNPDPKRGRAIRAGQNVCLFYPSANRDEEVFPDGDRFRIDRRPNDHVGFGRGEHVCLGAHLARLELRSLLDELRARIRKDELAGPVERVRSSFVGGIKRVPLRWEVAPAQR